MAAPVTARTGHVIGGQVVDTASERIDVVNPATEEVIGSVPAGTAADVDAAVAAATSAATGSSNAPGTQITSTRASGTPFARRHSRAPSSRRAVTTSL